VLAVQLAMRPRGRRLLVRYSLLLVAASVVAAAAPTPALFIAAHIVQGFCTSPIMNPCVFGAVALGPVVGGIQAGGGDWPGGGDWHISVIVFLPLLGGVGAAGGAGRPSGQMSSGGLVAAG
jgi:hypothetical protein